MFIKSTLLFIAGMLLVQPVFAHDDMGSDDKSCTTIAMRCLDAGYTRNASEDKEFWKSCMRPLLLNKTVAGVSVDSKEIKACRAAKIKQLKEELDELKEVN